MAGQIMLFAGSSNPDLARRIAEIVQLPLRQLVCNKFANGETQVVIKENCRGCDAFIIQSIAGSERNDCFNTVNNVNDNLMELHVLASALRSASARRITAVIPIYGYARQDKMNDTRSAITARVVAKHLQADGIDHVVTVELHASQVQGFFDIPVDNLHTERLLIDHMINKIRLDPTTVVVISPDAGGVARAIRISQKIGTTYAIISKNRRVPNEVERMDLVGDVVDRDCVLVDDMCDTAGTLIEAVKALRKNGAKNVWAYVTHGVFSDPAIERLNACDVLSGICVTNTLPQTYNSSKCNKIHTIDIAPLIAEVVRRTHNEESISVLFK
eukprot:TRINITY_DN7850_c0_g1_i1.p1 TRINITY_DN7850_c0_g1~~TRINITY_DN7850_c0_g1_i1.p1  ORF type:complete len:350 (+),score=80.02 TRINITY_DN7850_c0_g1_i1:66-1052(+)